MGSEVDWIVEEPKDEVDWIVEEPSDQPEQKKPEDQSLIKDIYE